MVPKVSEMSEVYLSQKVIVEMVRDGRSWSCKSYRLPTVF